MLRNLQPDILAFGKKTKVCLAGGPAGCSGGPYTEGCGFHPHSLVHTALESLSVILQCASVHAVSTRAHVDITARKASAWY